MTYRALTPAEVKKYYDWLVSVNHPKIVKDKKTLDYFMKMENRQELSSAYSASQPDKVKRNLPDFDPEKAGYTDVGPVKQEIFEEKLNSDYISDKVRNTYISAFNAVRENGGMGAPPRLRKALSLARGSVIKNYGNRQTAILTKEALDVADINPELLTNRQKELIEKYEGRMSRRSKVGRDTRKARGLRSKIGTLNSQANKLAESPDAFVRRVVRDGFKGWLKANPEYIRLGPGGVKLTPNQQADLYWKLLPEWEKKNWYEEIIPIQKHNNEIIKKYHSKGKIVPRKIQINDLKQLHHVQPRRGRREEKFGRVRGGHFPAQTTALKGDAYAARKSPHGLLHDPQLDHIYALFKDQNYMVFDLNDPNIISREPTKPGSTKPGEPKINQKAVSYLRDVATSIMNLKGVKNVGRKMLSFIPGIGWPFQYQASKGYLSDQSLSDIAKKGKAASVWAGAPGLVGEFLVDWDKVEERHRKLLDDPGMARRYAQAAEARKWWGGMPERVRGLLKPEEKKKRESIWT